MAHALARTVLGFGAARFALGLGEAGNFPGVPLRLSRNGSRGESAPSRPGSLMPARTSARSSTPLVVPVIALTWGWRCGVHRHRRASVSLAARVAARSTAVPRSTALSQGRARLHPERSGRSRSRTIPWGRLLPHRQTWAFAIGKFMTDPIWWFYLFWLPDFLTRTSRPRADKTSGRRSS